MEKHESYSFITEITDSCFAWSVLCRLKAINIGKFMLSVVQMPI